MRGVISQLSWQLMGLILGVLGAVEGLSAASTLHPPALDSDWKR